MSTDYVFDPSVTEESCPDCGAGVGETCKPDCPNWGKP